MFILLLLTTSFHLARAATAPDPLHQVVAWVDRLTCESALDMTRPVSIEAEAFAKTLTARVRADTTSRHLGAAFSTAFEDLMRVDVQTNGAEARAGARAAARDRLKWRVRAIAPLITGQDQLRVMARAVAVAKVLIDADGRTAPRSVHQDLEAAIENPLAKESEAIVRRALDETARSLNEVVLPTVKRRMSDVSVRTFLAQEIAVIRDILSGPSAAEPAHLRVPAALNRSDVAAIRLRNDLRLVAPSRRSSNGHDVATIDGHGLARLREVINGLASELAVTLPPGSLMPFDLPTIELIVTDATASARLLALLLNRIPGPALLPPYEGADADSFRARFTRRATPVTRRPSLDPRAPRLSGIKWYLSFLRPELLSMEQAAIAREEAAPWRLKLDVDGEAQADGEMRAGGFDRSMFKEWFEASEACVRWPDAKPAPVTTPAARSSVRDTLRDGGATALGVLLSVFYR